MLKFWNSLWSSN